MITFSCDHCGHKIEVDDAVAGKTSRCNECGYEMTVPTEGFRLEPIPEDELESAKSEPIEPYDLAGDEPPPIVLEPVDSFKMGIVDDPSRPGGIPEEFLADRAPLALDEDTVPDAETGPIELAPDEDRKGRS